MCYNSDEYYFYSDCRLMLQANGEDMENSVKRSLDRLTIFAKNKKIEDAIPAFSYTAKLLLQYAQGTGIKNIDYNYFSQFKQELENFVNKDFSDIKNHQRQIIDDILDTVNTQLFVDCLQPKAQESRITMLEYQDDQSPMVGKISTSQEGERAYGFNTSIEERLHNNIKQHKTRKLSKQQLEHESNQLKSAQLWELLTIAYQEHRIDEAYQLKIQYQLKYSQFISHEKNQLFKTIQLEYNTMISFYQNFDEEGWILDKIDKGVKLEYKIFEEEKQIAIKIESQFNISIQNFLAIVSEMDLFGNYVPFCYDSKQLKVISRNQKIGTSKIYIPALTDRQTYFYAAGYDRFKVNGSIFLYSKTINEDQVYQKKYGFKVPEKSDYIRLEYKFFIIQYIPVTRFTARVRLASKVDMKLNYLPQFLLNMSARKFAFDYFKNIMKVNKNYKGSQWEKKVKQKPDFYEFFKKKINQYMG